MWRPVERITLRVQRITRQPIDIGKRQAEGYLAGKTRSRHPPNGSGAAWTHARVRQPKSPQPQGSGVVGGFRQVAGTGVGTVCRPSPAAVSPSWTAPRNGLCQRSLIGLDDDCLAGFELNTEHASNGGRVEQAPYGELAQCRMQKTSKSYGEQVELVSAKDVEIDRACAVPNPAVEVVLDDGSHGFHGSIIAVPPRGVPVHRVAGAMPSKSSSGTP